MKATTRIFTLMVAALTLCTPTIVFAQPLPEAPQGKEEKFQMLQYMNQLEDCIKAEDTKTPDCRDEYDHIKKIYEDLNQQRMFLDPPLLFPTRPEK